MEPRDQHLKREAHRNPARFETLYQKWVSPVYRYFLYRVDNIKDAEDLTSQVFLKVYEQFPHYKENGHFPAWLFTIVRNQSADYFRSHGPVVPLETFEASDGNPDPLEHTAHAEELQRLRHLLRTLSEEEQELIRLRFVAQLRYKDIASILDRNNEAIRKQISRLLRHLQSQLEEKGHD